MSTLKFRDILKLKKTNKLTSHATNAECSPPTSSRPAYPKHCLKDISPNTSAPPPHRTPPYSNTMVPPIPPILYHCRHHRLIDDVFAYGHTGYDQEHTVPCRLALPCAHDFARDGARAVCGRVEGGAVVRCCVMGFVEDAEEGCLVCRKLIARVHL